MVCPSMGIYYASWQSLILRLGLRAQLLLLAEPLPQDLGVHEPLGKFLGVEHDDDELPAVQLQVAGEAGSGRRGHSRLDTQVALFLLQQAVRVRPE